MGLALAASLLGMRLVRGLSMRSSIRSRLGFRLRATPTTSLIYTLWLKRTTTLNIVIGGAAGAVPPLVGWAAVAHSARRTRARLSSR